MTARSLGKFYFTDGDTLERCYKESLSGFREWDQLEHAQDWVLLPDNMGEHLSIDETSLQDDLFTFLTNKDGHCQQGTLIAAVRGTKAEDVLSILLQIPAEARLKVKEITADLSGEHGRHHPPGLPQCHPDAGLLSHHAALSGCT